MGRKGRDTHTMYLVDYENVGRAYARAIDAHDRDRILVFSPCPFALDAAARKLEDKTGRPIKWVKTLRGRNSLDFQLVYHLGRMAERHPKWRYVIVSADSGYDCVIRSQNTMVSVRRLGPGPSPKGFRHATRKALVEAGFDEGLAEEVRDSVCAQVCRKEASVALSMVICAHTKDQEVLTRAVSVLKPIWRKYLP